MDMNNKCLACLEKVVKLYPLNGQILNCDQDVSSMIKYCTSIEVESCEELSSGVCVPCFKTLRIAYNFIIQFKENYEKLLLEKRSDYLDKVNNENDLSDAENQQNIEMNVLESKVILDYVDNQNQESADEEMEEAKYELVEEQQEEPDHEIEEQVENVDEEEEYEYQEVAVESLGDFLKTLNDDTSTRSKDYSSNVTVIKTQRAPEDNSLKPQTVIRRKIKMRFSCPICPSVYFASFENGFLPHMSTHKEHFHCNICVDEQVYNSDSFLNHFMKVHRYQCPYCNKSFTRTGTWTSHIKTHSTLRYHCSAEGCTKSFPTSWILKKHEAIHSSENVYFCSECNLDFKTYDTYMYHLKKHNGKRFLCMCCGRTFMQSVHLKYHMQQHTGIKHFKCDGCVKSYTSSTQLKKHKKRHHPEQFENIWLVSSETKQDDVYEAVI